ncbi:phosphotransferase family protein [Trujillonella humicola]|uniref:phosphotransferase family protein n=1 Tax=Trujillonella humicola TaxID=3383699 RepID=UPI0039065463
MSGRREWDAARTVDAARAAELVARVRPELAGAPVSPLGTGWDNTVFLVGDQVVRFPRRAVALPGFARELAVLPRIAALLPLPVPVPVWTGTDDDPDDPWPFAGAALVPGRELADAGMADGDRVPAAAATGRFLRVLHGPAVLARVTTQDLPTDPLDRGWPAARATQTDEALRGLVADGHWAGDPEVGRLLASARRLDRPDGEPALVHGDLRVRHLLVHEDRRAAGVIDWGDVCLADPAVDLGIGFAAFAGRARRAFLAAYGRIAGSRKLRARALAVRLSALLARYAAAEGRTALLAEAVAGLRRAVA